MRTIRALLERNPGLDPAKIDDNVWAATNTSSLTVGPMAATLSHPERVVGLHFFNPVAVLPLVAVARGERTSDEAVATAFEVAKRCASRRSCARTRRSPW